MAEKRKISIRKILQVFVTLVVTTCCVVAMVSASKIEDTKHLTSVAVHIRNDKKYHFVAEHEIMDMAVNNRNIDVVHTPVSKLDIHAMEQVILANPWIANAQVYIDNERVLQMYITQRIPVVRLFQQNGNSCYLDTTLSTMPLSANNIYYTTVVTNVPELKNDSMGWAVKKQIVTLVRHIQADSFWNAQVSQVILDSDFTFELVPTLGDQRILFGDASGMNEKFNNLFVFYKNVLNRIGWDKYETLDVRYKDQVIALPSLPYHGPVDKAVDKMNWINSMVETEAANDAKDSVKAVVAKTNQAVAAKKAAAKQVQKPVIKAKPKADKKHPIAAKKKAGKPDKKKVATPANNNKTKTNDKNKKTGAPKYVYPAKKNQ